MAPCARRPSRRGVDVSLLQITYVSRSTERFTARDLPDLVTASSRNNEAKGITGALYFSDGRFIQVLEGDERRVIPLYGSIMQDPRHTDVETVSIRPLTSRRFGEWGMGHLPAELAVHTAREAFRVARTPGAVWGTDTLNDILEQFERVLATAGRD